MRALCEMVRESLSASLDGEPGPLEPYRADVHLAGCGECRQWQERSHTVTRQFRLRTVDDDRVAPLSLHLAVRDTRPTRVPSGSALLRRARPGRRRRSR
jgi:predicted anti-sigma-YlaC factor YlaD